MLCRTRPAQAEGRGAALRRLCPLRRSGFLVLIILAAGPALAGDGLVLSGRIVYGGYMRLEAPDPALLTAANAAAIGLKGTGNGPNADDGNLNYARGDWLSRALLANLDLRWEHAGLVAQARARAWYDEGLRHDARPWGNAVNGYAAGQPLGDAGADRLTRFSGVALGEAWLEHALPLGEGRLLVRVGRQSAPWSERGAALETMGARDVAAQYRAGSQPQDARIAAPMLFTRIELGTELALEGFVQSFRPSALTICGSFWSHNDYIAEGCNWVMAGPPLGISDRDRVAQGAVMGRLPTVAPDAPNRGVALFWTPPGSGTELGFYHARYGSRLPMPSLRRSTRAGPPLIPGNPDGLNMAFFTDYPERIGLTAMSVTRRQGATTYGAEVSWRERMPSMLAPGDVLPALLSATAPALLRESVNAVPPGGVFRGYDLYSMAQLQLNAQHRWSALGIPLSGQVEWLGKHTPGLPDPALRRYGRSDVFGVGPVHGACTVNTGDAARQCSLRGYQTTNAWSYRLRLEARLPELAPALSARLAAGFSHEVKGWSGDFVLNEGRRTVTLGCQLEYRKRYFAELSYVGIWGGDYNPTRDHDTLAMAAGVRF
jgi:hypothetical protein